MSISEELLKLKELLDKGILTQEEYDKQKQRILVQSEIVNDNSNIKTNEYSKDVSVVFRQEKSKLHNLGILSIVFGFLSPLVAWILGGVGISKATQMLIEFPNSQEIENEKHLCKTGIIIGIVIFILALIVGWFIFLSF